MGRDGDLRAVGLIASLVAVYLGVPTDAEPRDHQTRARPETSWRILLALGSLRDNTLFADAKAILGEPTRQEDDAVLWNYGTGSRRMEPGVVGRIVVDGRETIVFTRHAEWTH